MAVSANTAWAFLRRRPAPLQVNYLGFPATLGAPYIDYIIADRVVIPEDEQRFWDEAVVTSPAAIKSMTIAGAEIASIPVRSNAGLPERGFVFCNFNQSYKLTPDTFAGWMRILKRVDGSVSGCWMRSRHSPRTSAAMPKARVLRRSASCFAPDRKPKKHLARLSLANLFLDSLPYNAHTTASDALWAGVPLMTRRGTAFPGRVAASLLDAAGLPELVTETQEDYEALAVRLATDPAALAAVKRKMTRDCPLFDTDLFRRRIELAYEKMWQAWIAGERPKAFSVG